MALDADTGEELWATLVGVADYTGTGEDSGNAGAPSLRGGDGPRSTPAMDGNNVYVMSSRLVLFCLDAATGGVIWNKDLIREHGGKHIPYENAASPVFDGNLIFVAGGGPGQSLLGIDKRDGKVVWSAHNEHLTHSTPAIATIDGIRQVIFFTRSGLIAVRPENGSLLWHHKFPFRVSAAITPVVAENMIYCSAGYGIGSGLCRMTGSTNGLTAMEVWRKPHNEPVANGWNTPVHWKGHLYGMFSFKKYLVGPLKCVELATSNVKWSQPGFGHGNVILVDGHLIALTGYGTLVLIEPDPEEYRERARAKVLNGKCWSTPIVSHGRLYVRSTNEAVCLDVSPDTDL